MNPSGSSDRSAERIGKIFVLFLMIAALALAGKKFIMPYFNSQIVEKTSTKSIYRKEIRIAHDSFLGYAVLRSEDVFKEMSSKGVLLSFENDEANYQKRIEMLRDGKVDLAVFTIDAYIKSASVTGGDFPGSIIAVIDETVGADAIVSYKSTIPALPDLNDPGVKFVFTPDSPSETLARILKADFNLPLLSAKWYETANGAEDVYKKLSQNPGRKEAYVLWEPYVSKALENSAIQILFDSSKVRGYIVDVLIANRKFLINEPDLLNDLLKSYFKALYHYQSSPDLLTDLLVHDAKNQNQPLTRDQAIVISRKISWKNTLENYAHFGILKQKTSLLHLEDMIRNITGVLIQTNGISKDPTQGNVATIFFDGCLKSLQQENFHPARKLNIVADGTSSSEEILAEQEPLRELTDEQWSQLVTLGELRVEQIAFGRGNAEITVSSRLYLDNLAERLKTYPYYYLKVVGHSMAIGDRDANLALSSNRAKAAADYLQQHGVSPQRLRSIGAEPAAGTGGSAQSVTFELLQMAY
ncbi:MAG: phosphate ABC transporter substrate-binding/OmpA family protein [Candidatus Wallbacteria bacterium]|nr:phosphate ABC transporter substrate-binding/OmpA family protein [Candidatus Wallbacteria bacterium]